METLQNHFIFQIFICYFAFWRSFASKKNKKSWSNSNLAEYHLIFFFSFAGYIYSQKKKLKTKSAKINFCIKDSQ
jgi:hypothetical protein